LKTLLFCTSYIASRDVWMERYERWLRHHAAFMSESSILCLIDDASPFTPEPSAVQTAFADEVLPTVVDRALLVRFGLRLGRRAVDDFPGWWRSFLYSVHVARHYDCQKIVHVESDAYILSNRLREFIDRSSSGWISLWCPRWNFPETAIQVICEDQFERMEQLWNQGWDLCAGRLPEQALPFTGVVKTARGDRYSEYCSEIPITADFAAQVTSEQSVWFR
jgi:hypothetical protein